MINILEQKVPPTASAGSFGVFRSSGTMMDDNSSFERLTLLIAFLKGHGVSGYQDYIPRSMSTSVISSLADEIPVMKATYTREVNLALYGQALAFLQRATSKSNGLLQAAALRKLDDLKNLPEDWDSYGANPISPIAITRAKSIVTSVMVAFSEVVGNVVRLTDVIPIADGGVQLEWVGPHAELEIEISPDGNIGLLYISGSGNKHNYVESENSSLADVYTAIARLIHSQYSN